MAIPYNQIRDHETRLLYERLDELIALLRNDETVFDYVMRALIAGVVPTAPAFSQTIPVVAITPVYLVENTVMSLMRVEITNDNLAIPLYVGNRDVTIPAGRVIQPGETIAFDLVKGQRLYGVVAAGVINAVISFSESAYQAVTNGPVIM